MREPLRSVLLFVLILAVVIALKINTLEQPYFWDSIAYVIPSASNWLYNSSLVIPTSMTNSHPPLFYALLALAWRLFGETLLVSHLLTLVVGAIGLLYTFKLGVSLYHSRHVGIVAVVLLLFYPLFFAQLGTVLLDLPVLTASVVATFYYLKQNRAAYLLAATVLVLIKETGLILVVSIFLFDLVQNIVTLITSPRPRNLAVQAGKALILLAPGLAVGAWILYRQSHTSQPFLTTFVNLGWYRHVFRTDALNYFLVGNFLFILNIPNLIYLINLVRKGFVKALLRPEALFLLYFLVTLIFYSLTEDFARYFLPVYPFLFILSAAALYDLFIRSHKAPVAYVVTGLVVTLFIILYPGNLSLEPWELDSTLAYLDAIETHVQADTFILLNYPDRPILTAWPMTEELGNPKYGYVDRRVESLYVASGTRLDPTRDYVVLFSPDSDQPDLLRVLEGNRLTRLARFEKNGKLAEVYLLPGLSSSQR